MEVDDERPRASWTRLVDAHRDRPALDLDCHFVDVMDGQRSSCPGQAGLVVCPGALDPAIGQQRHSQGSDLGDELGRIGIESGSSVRDHDGTEPRSNKYPLKSGNFVIRQ